MPDGEQPESGFPIARASRRATLTSRFNPAMLTTARESRFLSQTALAKKIGVSQALIGKWEADLSAPNDAQIEQLADALEVQTNFFFVDRPRRLASMSDYYHRAFSRARRTDVKAAHARCSVVDLQVDRLLDIATIPEDQIPLIDPRNHKGDVEKVAMMARTAMGVGSGPVKNLVEVIESCGGIVIDRVVEVDDVDALCRWVPELPKLFFVNGSRSPDRIRFSLAHELGHTIMHFGWDCEPRLAEEQANRFAAAFLMPAQEIKRDLKWSLNITDLAALKRKWRVAMSAIARRALTLGVVDDDHYKSLCIQMSRRGWRKTEPVEIDHESPSMFSGMLHQVLDSGYTIHDLANLLFMGEADVRKLLREEQSPTWERESVRLRLTE